MDFSYLIELAKENDKQLKDKPIKFTTEVSKPKKHCKSGPNNDAVKKHLRKLDETKLEKNEEFIKQRSNLLALRSENNHSKKRIKTLLTRTKGASKSVLEDAKDIATASGETQCDEDDYGYESSMSQNIFNKLKNTYAEIPEDERLKFKKNSKSNLNDIKQRVLDSLKQKEEESLGIRKRNRTRKSKSNKSATEEDDFINDGDSYKKFHSEADDCDKVHSSNSKKKYKGEKQSVAAPFKEDKFSKFKYKNKEANDKMKNKLNRKAQDPPTMNFSELMKIAQNKEKTPTFIDPLEELEKLREQKNKLDDRPMTASEKRDFEEQQMYKLKKKEKISAVSGVTVSGKNNNFTSNKRVEPNCKLKNKKLPDISFPKHNSSSVKKELPKPKNIKTPVKKDLKIASENSNKLSKKPLAHKSSPIQSCRSKLKSENADLSKKRTRIEESEDDYDSGLSKKQTRIEESEDEYDSEMDDFIADEEDDVEDYSSEISKLFKYDKSKYDRSMEDDTDDMEASYFDLQKEERKSAKIGLMEDLMDMKREEEMKRTKLMNKKKGKF